MLADHLKKAHMVHMLIACYGKQCYAQLMEDLTGHFINSTALTHAAQMFYSHKLVDHSCFVHWNK